MSATFNPYGFSHVERIGGKPRSQTLQFPLTASLGGAGYATSLAAGDPVAFSASGAGGYVIQAIPGTNVAAANSLIGTFVSVNYTNPQGTIVQTTLWTANTPIAPGTLPTAIVNMDPNVIYQVQCNAPIAAVTNAVQTGIGLNFNFAVGAPNINTKTSTFVLDTNAGGGPEVWRNCKIIGLAQIPNNAWTDAFPDVLVVFNNTAFKQGTTGTN